MKKSLILLLPVLMFTAPLLAQIGVGVAGGTQNNQNRQRSADVEEYQHQYYVYNESGKKVKLRIVAKTDDDGNELPFDEKEITLKRNDTVYLGNFMSTLANVQPQNVFHIFVLKRSWIFFTVQREPYLNVSRKKIGTDAVNYHMKIMGIKPKTNKFDE